ncbi:MAG: acyltransferase [Clostridia bacterium]|nr:acyltransferase [Clostridia bacterium]
MTTLKQRYINYTQTERDGRLPVLDGARTLFVLIVGAYHIWQQSWLTPVIPWFNGGVSLDFLMRSGYIWVDALLLLSGFLLYLPYAEANEDGKRLPRVLPFYRNRLLRIAPSYYLNVLIMLFFVALPRGSYNTAAGTLNGARMTKDLLAHATFTHNLFQFSYTGSPLNGTLWTLGVEMQFYLLFPLVARCFGKKPLLTYLGMAAAAFTYRWYVAGLPDTTLYFNQLPAHLDVYANGMVAACVYAALKRRMKQDKWTELFFTALFFLAATAIVTLLKAQAGTNGYENIRLGQMSRRFPLSVYVSLGMLGLLYGVRPLRLLFGNRLTRIFAEISFQFYMWHQVFAVQLKNWKIPVSVYESPWIESDRPWQYTYTLLCFAGAIAISALVTYAFEQPIARFGRRKDKKRK